MHLLDVPTEEKVGVSIVYVDDDGSWRAEPAEGATVLQALGNAMRAIFGEGQKFEYAIETRITRVWVDGQCYIIDHNQISEQEAGEIAKTIFSVLARREEDQKKGKKYVLPGKEEKLGHRPIEEERRELVELLS